MVVVLEDEAARAGEAWREESGGARAGEAGRQNLVDVELELGPGSVAYEVCRVAVLVPMKVRSRRIAS